MKYKLIACDIDGTLLNDKKEIDDKTKKAISKVNEMGVLFLLSSGRPIITLRQFIDALGFDYSKASLIALNGATLLLNGKIIYSYALEKENLIKVVEYIKSNDLSFIAWENNKLYYNRINDKTKDYISICEKSTFKYDNFYHEEIKDYNKFYEKKINKVIIIDNDKNIQNIKCEFSKYFSEDVSFATSQSYFLEIYKKGINKSYALEEIERVLNIKKEEIIAIGDGLNDLEMIKHAKTGVAMGNACLDIKNAATFITKTNNESGVAYALEKLVIGEQDEKRKKR